MKIAVFVKRVPDTEARIRLAPGGGIDPSGVKYVTNPYDEFAIEAALRLRESAGTGSVTAFSLGGEGTGEVIRGALALGADDGVVLTGKVPADPLVVATALADEIRAADYDLLLFGMKAIDDDLQAVGPMVAELLGLPAVTAVSDFTVEGGSVSASRSIEGGTEVVRASLPCVLTITKGSYEPRYASLKGIMAAKKKPLEEREARLGEARVHVLEMTHPAERKPGRVVGEGPEAVEELVRLLREEARVL